MQKKKKKLDAQRLPQTAVAVESDHADEFLDNTMKVVGNFGFQQILLPPVEERRPFAASPILARMYGDKLLAVPRHGNEDMIVAPTKIPAVINRYLANVKNFGPHVSKWFHVSPVLRYDSDGYKTAHEIGLFVLGEDSALASAQLINTTAEILRELGIAEFTVQINSLGCPACQNIYQDLLSSHLARDAKQLCRECEADFERNPLVLWNCATGSCRVIAEALPPIIDSLDTACKTTLTSVLESIDELNIPYTLNPSFIPQFLRHQVVFQFATADPAQSIGYGGNFSPLVLEMGGTAATSMLGMITTFEQLLSFVPEERRRQGPKIEVFMVPLGSMAARKALVLHRDLQHSGILSAEAMLMSPSIKNQLKVAAEKKCEIALIIGQKEAIDETVILRDMRSGMQEVFALERIIEEVKKRLGK